VDGEKKKSPALTIKKRCLMVDSISENRLHKTSSTRKRGESLDQRQPGTSSLSD